MYVLQPSHRKNQNVHSGSDTVANTYGVTRYLQPVEAWLSRRGIFIEIIKQNWLHFVFVVKKNPAIKQRKSLHFWDTSTGYQSDSE